jgi:hypothetical protein
MGTVIASGAVAIYGVVKLWRGGWVVSFPRRSGLRPDWSDHPRALPLRPPHRDPGNRDERGRRADARLHRLARAERRGAGGLRRLLYAALLPRHLDLGRADGRRRRDGGAEPRRRQPRPRPRGGRRGRPRSASRAPRHRAPSSSSSPTAPRDLRDGTTPTWSSSARSSCACSASPASSSRWRSPTPAGSRAPATPAARSTSRSSPRSRPAGDLLRHPAALHPRADAHLAGDPRRATWRAASSASCASTRAAGGRSGLRSGAGRAEGEAERLEVSGQLSAVSRQRSAVSGQLPAIR